MAVGTCTVCEQTYVTMLPDVGICRLCEIREDPWRNKIADELRLILDDYTQQVIDRIRNT